MHATLALLALLGLATNVEPAQFCSERVSHTAPATRFAQNGDGTVTDRHTGLTWQRCPLGFALDDAGTAGDPADDRCLLLDGAAQRFTWQEALQGAADLNAAGGYAGHADWRLPDVKELLSIAERKCILPALDLSVFPDVPPVPSYQFWSSTTYWYGDRGATVDFTSGANSFALKNQPTVKLLVRLVR